MATLFTLVLFSCHLNLALLKNGPASGSKGPIFVSTVLRDQATGSVMHNAPALQEDRVEGHEQHTYELKGILPQTGSRDWNKDQQKPPH